MIKSLLSKFTQNINNLIIKNHTPPPLGRWNRGNKKFIDYYDNCFTVYKFETKHNNNNKNNYKKF